MKIVDSIIKMLSSNKEMSLAAVSQAPDGVCPNCWGRDEYSGDFYKAINKKGLNAGNVGAHVGWVQEYANKHFSDIAIVSDGENQSCNKCKMTSKIA